MTSPTILKDGFFCFVFLFTCHSSQCCHSFLSLLAEDKLWLFYSHQQAAWLLGAQLLWHGRRMASSRRVLRRLRFYLSPLPCHSWEACCLPRKHEHKSTRTRVLLYGRYGPEEESELWYLNGCLTLPLDSPSYSESESERVSNSYWTVDHGLRPL